MKTVFQNPGDVLGLERGVRAVPSEDAENGEFCGVGVLVEMGEGDLAVLSFPKGGDEKNIGGIPALAVGRIGGVSLFDDERVEDAAQDDDGQLGLAELDEEDAEGLTTGQRAELADGAVLEFLCFLVFEAEFVGIVFEGELVELVVFDGSVELVAEVGDEFCESGDGAEVSGHGWDKFWKAEMKDGIKRRIPGILGTGRREVLDNRFRRVSWPPRFPVGRGKCRDRSRRVRPIRADERHFHRASRERGLR